MGGDLIWRLLTPDHPVTSGPKVALRGKSITLYTGVPGQAPTAGQWTGLSPKLYAPGWRINDPVGGAVATDGDMAEVLSDLRGIYFLASWRFGEPSVIQLDDVFMSGTPLPVGCEGDLNGDGDVTAEDFVILARNFGCVSGAGE